MCVLGSIAKSFNSHLIFAHLQNSVRQIVGMFLRTQQHRMESYMSGSMELWNIYVV